MYAIELMLFSWFFRSNFQFIWPWEEWAHVLDLPKWAPQRVFVQEVLEREVRLSYWDKVKQVTYTLKAVDNLDQSSMSFSCGSCKRLIMRLFLIPWNPCISKHILFAAGLRAVSFVWMSFLSIYYLFSNICFVLWVYFCHKNPINLMFHEPRYFISRSLCCWF